MKMIVNLRKTEIAPIAPAHEWLVFGASLRKHNLLIKASAEGASEENFGDFWDHQLKNPHEIAGGKPLPPLDTKFPILDKTSTPANC